MLSHSLSLPLSHSNTSFGVDSSIPKFSFLLVHSLAPSVPLIYPHSFKVSLLYLLTSLVHILLHILSPSPPRLLVLFFFELRSAYSRAYNLTPPSSLTLSLHPLAKLPFRSRGNPLISQPQPPRLHQEGRSLMRSGGEEHRRTQNPSNDCGLCFYKLSMFSQRSPYGVWGNVEVDSGWFSF